ncbi:MAG: hypothetical protein R3E31_04450 [Chloroflexota bacterium]
MYFLFGIAQKESPKGFLSIAQGMRSGWERQIEGWKRPFLCDTHSLALVHHPLATTAPTAGQMQNDGLGLIDMNV